jgi:hypothetical protein
MKALALIILLLTTITDPAKIGKINRAKQEARQAYLAGDYKTAAALYEYLADSLNVREDEVLLNLAHARFQLNDTARARTTYQQVAGSATPSVRSTAQQQLGVLANRLGKAEEALEHFKEALKADPANRDARYNYELLKKKLDEQKKKEEQQQQNQPQKDQQEQEKQKNQDQKKNDKNQQKQDQQKSDQQKQDEQQQKADQQKQNEQSGQEEQKKEGKQDPASSVTEKLEQLKMSEEKAKMLLEAMKNQEIQYLQQNKRKPTKPKDKGKPDW